MMNHVLAPLLAALIPAASANAAPTPTAAANISPAWAIVAQDGTALRSAPRDSANAPALLTQGDLLEVRGQRLDHLQVWDHRRERGGYVRAIQLRTTTLAAAQADELLAVLRFVRDTPGQEALGIAYVAAYLKAAPAGQITAEPFDALGVMAERLAGRASATRSGKAAETTGAHLGVAAAYGVRFRSFERDGRVTLCYDGEAFRRVLALAGPQPVLASPQAQARAVLALTRHDCIDPALPASERQALDLWRAQTLDRIDAPTQAALPPVIRNRLLARQAGVWATLAHQRSRQGGAAQEAAQAAGQRALQALARIDPAELGDDEMAEHAEAQIRVGASRWAGEAKTALPRHGRIAVYTEAGEPGQTCLVAIDSRLGHAGAHTRRCTWGTLWAASARWHPSGQAMVVAVQPLEAWTELWVLSVSAAGELAIGVLPPAAAAPGLGYAEFNGWLNAAPGAAGSGASRLRVLREARVAQADGQSGPPSHRCEIVDSRTLASERLLYPSACEARPAPPLALARR